MTYHFFLSIWNSVKNVVHTIKKPASHIFTLKKAKWSVLADAVIYGQIWLMLSNMVSFDWCRHIFLLHESVWGMKTTDVCSISNIAVIYIYYSKKNITEVLFNYIDSHKKKQIWSVLVDAVKRFYYTTQSEVWKLLIFFYNSILWIKRGYTGTINSCEQNFEVIVFQYCCNLYITVPLDLKL